METLDDLLSKRRRSALSAAEQRRLERALQASREYEVALLAQDAFDRDGAAQPGDAQRVRDLVSAVERRLVPPPRLPRPWRGSLLAAPVLIAGVAAASLGLSRLVTREDVPATPSVEVPSVEAPPLGAPPALEPARDRESTREPESTRDRESTREPESTRALAPSPAVEPGVEPPASPREPAASSRRRLARPLPARAISPARTVAPTAPLSTPDESARSLFRRANRLRQQDWSGAAALYEQLIQRHPTSNEAGVSEVALGKWSLAQGRSGDALGWFRAYLRREPGALTAEALFGEARSLESIGSRAAARVPWQRLLDNYPASPYANVARQRLTR